jgi:hypothetical protein
LARAGGSFHAKHSTNSLVFLAPLTSRTDQARRHGSVFPAHWGDPIFAHDVRGPSPLALLPPSNSSGRPHRTHRSSHSMVPAVGCLNVLFRHVVQLDSRPALSSPRICVLLCSQRGYLVHLHHHVFACMRPGRPRQCSKRVASHTCQVRLVCDSNRLLDWLWRPLDSFEARLALPVHPQQGRTICFSCALRVRGDRRADCFYSSNCAGPRAPPGASVPILRLFRGKGCLTQLYHHERAYEECRRLETFSRPNPLRRRDGDGEGASARRVRQFVRNPVKLFKLTLLCLPMSAGH